MLSLILLFCLLSLLKPSMPQQSAIITELPEYSSLAACAQSAVSSEALLFSNFWCSSITVPTALASCICLRGLSSAAVSNDISELATSGCGATASQDLTSALSVLTTYCLAASHGAAAAMTTTAGALTTSPPDDSTRTPALGSSSVTVASPTSRQSSTSITLLLSTEPGVSSPSSGSSNSGGGGGLSESDKIALGTGIGIGVPAFIIAALTAWLGYIVILEKRKKNTERERERESSQAEQNAPSVTAVG